MLEDTCQVRYNRPKKKVGGVTQSLEKGATWHFSHLRLCRPLWCPQRDLFYHGAITYLCHRFAGRGCMSQQAFLVRQ